MNRPFFAKLENLKPRAEPKSEVVGLEPEADSLDLLQSVYRNPDQPLHTRIRCAAMALPFERPKLAVTATISSEDFADKLDRAIARSRGDGAKVIEHQPGPAETAVANSAREHPASELGATLRRR